MSFFIEQILIGLSNGGIYAVFALALVMIYKTSGHVNLAQGEIAMISTMGAWSLLQLGLPVWLAIPATLVLSFGGGVALERVVVRPFSKASEMVVLALMVGLFLGLHSLGGAIWGYEVKPFPSPFSDTILQLGGDLRIKAHTLGTLLTTLVLLSALWAFFRYTRLGMMLRAAADNPESSRYVGIKVTTMLSLGWGFAAAVGALAGIMIAPVTFLDPSLMFGPLIFAFAGALLGGISSPFGAAAGGLLIGVVQALLAAFVPYGNEFRELFAFVIIICVLLVRPAGLFGTLIVKRV